MGIVAGKLVCVVEGSGLGAFLRYGTRLSGPSESDTPVPLYTYYLGVMVPGPLGCPLFGPLRAVFSCKVIK